ncbi:MAG TPA: chemotaxis protein CheA [Candidatus Dormibacteraeota bacterium]|nr:chemotaxis protein CheA [Candidatus Dormibacteraeota bacterium]
MNYLPDDRAAELRAFFFESASEVLQSLNEAGLELEARPGDEEVLRRVRRAVHTLKGDSAACGFTAISGFAHEIEDVLTPEVAQARGVRLAEVVLAAADAFGELLRSCQNQTELPALDHILAMARALGSTEADSAPDVPTAQTLPAKFDWTEYEQLMVAEAVHRGELVYNVALRIDPDSHMRAAAFQLVRNVLHSTGTVIALRPEDNVAAATAEIIEAAVATLQAEDKIIARCKIPSIVSNVRVERVSSVTSPEQELLADLLEAQSTAAAATSTEFEGTESTMQPMGASAAVVAVSENSLRIDSARIDSVMNLVGELIIGKSMLNRALAELEQRHARDPVRAKLADAVSFQTRVLDELHKCVLKIRMVPVEQLFRRFPRVVRDVAKQCGKDVALEIAGKNTDLDKSILDALAEPLMHLIRNAVDHGIESADQRVAAGKPARGTLYLNAYHQGTQVVIEVRDDGEGIDLQRVRAQAAQNGLLKAEEAARISDQDALNLIFESGFSTSKEITSVSGRGVGMDVVRTVMDRLKGTVNIISQPGRGTTIQLRAPLTLASIQTLLFRIGGRLFAIPLSSVVEITRINDRDISRVDQREVLRLREQILSLVRLERFTTLHAVDSNATPKNKHFVIVIGAAEKRFGLIVDSMAGEEELVIKALPAEIVSSDLVSGASILGDGTVVLILNVPAILSRLTRTTPLGAIA